MSRRASSRSVTGAVVKRVVVASAEVVVAVSVVVTAGKARLVVVVPGEGGLVPVVVGTTVAASDEAERAPVAVGVVVDRPASKIDATSTTIRATPTKNTIHSALVSGTAQD